MSTTADWKRIEELAEKANPRPWVAWSEQATGANNWAGKAAIAGLPLTNVDRMTVFWKRDAEYIAATANAAPDMAARLRRLEEMCDESGKHLNVEAVREEILGEVPGEEGEGK